MVLTIERKWMKDTYTIGWMYVNGQFFCDTLEDKVEDANRNGRFDGAEKKTPGRTAIPFGTYKVVYNWSNKFGKNLPLLIDVPHFSGIRIHPGNSEEDTSGCILVGLNTEPGKVTCSRYYSEELNRMIEYACHQGEQIFIEIV